MRWRSSPSCDVVGVGVVDGVVGVGRQEVTDVLKIVVVM